MSVTPIQILYSQHLAKFGSKQKLIESHSQYLEDYKNGKLERSAHTEIKARLLTKLLKVAEDEQPQGQMERKG